jgi:hypothetical protein
MTPAELHEKLQGLRNGRPAPLPLLDGQATAQAVRLRSRGMSYTDIAITMATYHHVFISPAGWRSRCRQAGEPPRYRGRPFGHEREQRAA